MFSSSPHIINTAFDRVFVINLERRKDRWQQIVKELSRVGIQNYERFDAINPRFEEISPITYSAMQCAPWTTDRNQYLAGSCGCKFSHVEVVKLSLERGYNKILILEDDVKFNFFSSRNLKRALQELPEDWELLYFAGNNVHQPEPYKANISLVKRTFSTCAYAVNLRIGKIIESFAVNSGLEIDVYYADNIQARKRSYLIRPGIAKQRAGWSDIVGTKVNYGSLFR